MERLRNVMNNDSKLKRGRMSLATSPLLDSNQQRKHYLNKNNALVQLTLTTADMNH